MLENVLTFKLSNVKSGEFYIDIAQAMSMVNRKLYRQQGLWHVHGACVYVEDNAAAPSTGVIYEFAIGGAPRTWVTRNSLVKGFKAWQEQQKRGMDASSESIKPTWMDFKVWLNDNHRTTGNTTPTSGHMFGGDDPYDAGEWSPAVLCWEDIDSTVVPPTISTRETQLHILGPDNGNTNVGLIAAYQNSRAVVQSPDPLLPTAVASNIYVKSEEPINEVAVELVKNLDEQNDEPPYSQLSYPGGAANGNEPLLYAFATNANTVKRKVSLNGFAAPNGLLECQFNTAAAGATCDLWLQLFVSHREAY